MVAPRATSRPRTGGRPPASNRLFMICSFDMVGSEGSDGIGRRQPGKGWVGGKRLLQAAGETDQVLRGRQGEGRRAVVAPHLGAQQRALGFGHHPEQGPGRQGDDLRDESGLVVGERVEAGDRVGVAIVGRQQELQRGDRAGEVAAQPDQDAVGVVGR